MNLIKLLSAVSLFSVIKSEIIDVGGLKVDIDYSIEEFESSTGVLELFNSDTITLVYNVENDADSEHPLSIIGVSGTFNDPASNDIVSNITTGSVGPITLENGQSQQFKQAINLNLVPNNYILKPIVYMAVDNQIVPVTVKPLLANVSDIPISLFNPQLLFLELVLIVTIGVVGLVLYDLFGKNYFNNIVPKKTVKKDSVPVESSKGYDSSWIPKHHIKKTT
ncbi:increased recombination centers protein 22 [[Candida] jaroonii]|uniref:Increased recombination centers protein 22 n=1 Tax=[Candida] jaroonii TaxID=467808 RepID=A0ACA9Y3Z2_9ASCO|nr:increased recombination centers protein 22 [[Candida] jaroonii]